MDISCTIDWIRYSAPNPKRLTEMIPYFLDIDRENRIKPLPHYTHACSIAPAGRIDWNMTNEQQGCLVTFAGQDIIKNESEGMPMVETVDFVSKHEAARMTRLDLACDIIGLENAPDDILQEWRAGRVKTRARGIEQWHGYCKQQKRTGNTVYIGSREGENYLRIYDKGKQKELDDLLWSRIEMELKGSKAQIATRNIAGIVESERRVPEVFVASLTRFFDCPELEWWGELLRKLPGADTSSMIGQRHKAEDNRTWLMTQAVPAVEKAILDDNFEVISKIQNMLNRWENWSI